MRCRRAPRDLQQKRLPVAARLPTRTDWTNNQPSKTASEKEREYESLPLPTLDSPQPALNLPFDATITSRRFRRQAQSRRRSKNIRFWLMLSRSGKKKTDRQIAARIRANPILRESGGVGDCNKEVGMSVYGSQNTVLPFMNLVRVKGLPILQQLQIEERLLRTSTDNWCIINDGTSLATIVMGISGKPAELLETRSVLRDKVPVIRRFTGGGTVLVDQGTIFVTFICNKDALPNLQPYPRPIMSWSSVLYDRVFHGIGDFHLRENDYVFGDRKFGGNAQSITKSRWIHHTSFLWDYEFRNMSYLRVPKRAPEYRLGRNHSDFICRLKDYMPRSSFIDKTAEAATSEFVLNPISLEDIDSYSKAEFCATSKLLSEQELEAAVVEGFHTF